MNPRHPRTVLDVSAPLEHYLIPVPPAGDTVCAVCHGAVYDGYRNCFQCNKAIDVLGELRLDAVAFVSLAPVPEQMARDLYTYKRPTVPAELRRPRMVGLSATLWRWLAIHEQCLATAADTRGFDLVTTVPSTSGRTDEHPLPSLVGKIVVGTGERVQETLALSRTDVGPRDIVPDRFVATADVSGRNILVIDDTWTTGAKMQAASAALKQAGARHVGGVAIGRWFKTDFKDNAAWLKEAKRARWSWETCCLQQSTTRLASRG